MRDAVEQAGVEWLRIPNVDVSLRPHPVQTPKGLMQLRAGGAALAAVARDFGAQVLHANTPRAGLMGAVARRYGGPPMVVRAHEHLPLSPIGRASRSVIVRASSAIAAVSEFTAEKFNEGLGRTVARCVYNSIDHARFDPQQVRPAGLRVELGLDPNALLIGQIAQITPWKGQAISIRALAQARAAGLDAHLMLVGKVVFGGKAVRNDNHAYERELEELVTELGVGSAVHFLGQRQDVPEILADLDLSMLPSWEEPFGLATVESMAMGTPRSSASRARAQSSSATATRAGCSIRAGSPTGAMPQSSCFDPRGHAGGSRHVHRMRSRGSATKPTRPGCSSSTRRPLRRPWRAGRGACRGGERAGAQSQPDCFLRRHSRLRWPAGHLMRILFVNHTATISGAEVALMRLTEGLRRDHTVALACPDGPLAGDAAAAGIERVELPPFETSLRPHPCTRPWG